MTTFESLVEAAATSIATYLPGFFRRNPKLARFKSVKMEDGGSRSGNGAHPEAEVYRQTVIVYDKFWLQSQALRDWMLAHELGHWALHETVGLSGIMGVVDLFSDLPFGNDSSEEAFADCFASYFLDGDVQKKFPNWVAAVELVLKKL